jgi:phenylalanyl-tRNA synthetase beta chain
VAEGLEEVGRIDPRVVVGRIVAVEPHPRADKLQVCRVDAGEEIVVVSGAPGLRAGLRVPVARVGAVLPSGTTVGAVDLRGVASAGMLCSELELGLSDDGSGVLELGGQAPVGTSLVELTGIADTVLVLDVTPNRADCLSILGVAREIAALTGARYFVRCAIACARAGRRRRARRRSRSSPSDGCAELPGAASSVACASGRRRSRCGSACAVPACGRSNAVVDATNYANARARPAAPCLRPGTRARRTHRGPARRAGEPFTTLDGVARTLEAGDLVIADGGGPVALAVCDGWAGIRGERRDDARSCSRAPSSRRRACGGRRGGSASSRRRPIASSAGSIRSRWGRRSTPRASLIARLAGGTVAPGVVRADGDRRELASPAIRFRPARAMLAPRRPGREDRSDARLRALGAACSGDGAVLVVAPPSHRGDLRVEEDLVEEIARLGGYDAVPTTLPSVTLHAGEDSPSRVLSGRLR